MISRTARASSPNNDTPPRRWARLLRSAAAAASSVWMMPFPAVAVCVREVVAQRPAVPGVVADVLGPPAHAVLFLQDRPSRTLSRLASERQWFSCHTKHQMAGNERLVSALRHLQLFVGGGHRPHPHDRDGSSRLAR